MTARSSPAPLIFEPPLSGTGGVAQIWAGASGLNGGGGTQWGGANVYVSVDNATYSQIAVEMDMTPKAAKSLLYRARNQLRVSLTALMDEGS